MGKPMNCGHCGKSFQKTYLCQAHIRTEHGELGIIQARTEKQLKKASIKIQRDQRVISASEGKAVFITEDEHVKRIMKN